jgi:hypothetical protein
MPEAIVHRLVDPSVTAEELEQAQQPASTVFDEMRHATHPDQQDFIGSVPDKLLQPLPPHRHGQERPGYPVEKLRDGSIRPPSLCNSPHQAIAALKAMRVNHTPIGGEGLCLYNIRHFAWNVNALWPSAEQAALHGAPIHRYTRFSDAPRGMTIVFLNNELGHIVLGLGGGLCDSSDYHEAGFNGVASIENVAGWCHAVDWYGIEVVNHVDVWPNHDPKPRHPYTKADLVAQLRRDHARAQSNGHERKARGLHHWITEIGEKL